MSDSEPPRPRYRWPRLLDVEGSAEYLGISPSLIREYINEGVLIPSKLPVPKQQSISIRRTLIDIDILDAFAEKCRSKRV